MSNWSIRTATIASKLTDVLIGREHSLEHEKEMSSYDNNYSECLRDQDFQSSVLNGAWHQEVLKHFCQQVGRSASGDL